MTFRGVVCLRGKIFALSYGGKCAVQRLDTLVGGKYLHIEDTSDLNIAPLNASAAELSQHRIVPPIQSYGDNKKSCTSWTDGCVACKRDEKIELACKLFVESRAITFVSLPRPQLVMAQSPKPTNLEHHL
jgi:hypothetical protein